MQTENLIHEFIEYTYAPQTKAMLKKLISENFRERTYPDGLTFLEELPKDPDELEGESEYKIKTHCRNRKEIKKNEKSQIL